VLETHPPAPSGGGGGCFKCRNAVETHPPTNICNLLETHPPGPPPVVSGSKIWNSNEQAVLSIEGEEEADVNADL